MMLALVMVYRIPLTPRTEQISGIFVGALFALLFIRLFSGELRAILHRLAPMPPYLAAAFRIGGIGFMTMSVGLMLKFMLPDSYRSGIPIGFVVTTGLLCIFYARQIAYKAIPILP